MGHDEADAVVAQLAARNIPRLRDSQERSTPPPRRYSVAHLAWPSVPWTHGETSLLRRMTVEEYFHSRRLHRSGHEYVSGELYAMSRK